MADFPLRLQLDVPGGVALHEEAMNALEDDKIFQRGEVAGLALIDDEALVFGINERLVLSIHRETRRAEVFRPQTSLLRETERGQELEKRVLVDGHVRERL